MAVCQGGQFGTQQTADGRGVGHQLFVINHIKHCGSCGHGDRVSTEGVEVRHSVGEGIQNPGLGCHRGDGQTISHRLTHRDDIGQDAVTDESPHRLTGAGKARLHLIGDEHAAGLMHSVDYGCQNRRIGIDPVGGEDGVDDQGTQSEALGLQVLDRGCDISGETHCEFSRRHPIAVRCRDHAYVRVD